MSNDPLGGIPLGDKEEAARIIAEECAGDEEFARKYIEKVAQIGQSVEQMARDAQASDDIPDEESARRGRIGALVARLAAHELVIEKIVGDDDDSTIFDTFPGTPQN